MVLTSKQKDDLNRAIAEYLQKHGFANTLRQFEEESNINFKEVQESNKQGKTSTANTDILEKKWVSITRLQKKVMELESENQRLQEENNILKRKRPGVILSNGNDSSNNGQILAGNGGNESHDQDQSFIPKEPAKFVMQGHRSQVTQVAFHPTYSIVATCSEDGSIRLWDFESGQLERALKGHMGTVNSITFDSQGKYMASSSTDLSIRIWDLSQYTCIRTLYGHEHNVSDVKFLPNGDFLISASRDKTLKLWEVVTGFCKRTYEGHEEWVKCLRVHESGTQFASGSSDQTVMVWNLDANQPLQVLRGHEHVVECVVYANVPISYVKDKIGKIEENANKDDEEQKSQASDSNSNTPSAKNSLNNTKSQQSTKTIQILISGSRDKNIIIWNPQNAQQLFTLKGHDNWVRSLAVHNNNRYLYSCSDDKSLRVWDLEKMRQARKIHDAHNHFISSVAFNPSYLILATGSVDTTVKIWDLKDY
ncbi:hypothetical protein ABPG74_015260 [Tetrahymena malaccensis]